MLLVAGYWLLVAGYWLLVTGCWFLADGELVYTSDFGLRTFLKQ
jgi:hypothetical protein